jgi:hypothetical protein
MLNFDDITRFFSPLAEKLNCDTQDEILSYLSYTDLKSYCATNKANYNARNHGKIQNKLKLLTIG